MTISQRQISSGSVKAIRHSLDPSTIAGETIILRPEQVGDMVTSAELDAKIATSEARTDTKFAEMMGELRVISCRLDHIDSTTRGLRLNVWLAAATALGLGVAAMAFGASQFGNGVMVTTASVQNAADAKKIAQDNAAEVQALRNDLGTFIQTIRQERVQPGDAPLEPWRTAPSP